MQALNLPKFDFKIITTDGSPEIWDEFRKKYVQLTPEEWVRQHFLKYMQLQLGYPKPLLKVEFEVRYNKRRKRPDIVAYNNQGLSTLIVECKAPSVKITQAVFDQVSVYNSSLDAKYLVVTNGLEHYCCVRNSETGGFEFVDDMPRYE